MRLVAVATIALLFLLTFLRLKSAARVRKVRWIEPEDGIQYDMWPEFILQSHEYSSLRG